MSASGNASYWGYVKDGLCLLVIPLLMWGIRLETTLAVQDKQIAQLEKQVTDNRTAMKTIEATVQANSIQLAKLDGKMDSLDDKIDDIKRILEQER